MKKLAITLTAFVLCSMGGYCAEIPINCPVLRPGPAPCAAAPMVKSDCPDAFQSQTDRPCQVTTPCMTKSDYMSMRCELYKKLCLNQNQTVKAQAIDNKYFDEIEQLKECYVQEKCKYEKLKCAKACRQEIRCQKDKMNDAKDRLKKKQEEYCDCFKALLTSCQLKDFKKMHKDYDCTCKKKVPDVQYSCDCEDRCKDDCGCGCD